MAGETRVSMSGDFTRADPMSSSGPHRTTDSCMHAMRDGAAIEIRWTTHYVVRAGVGGEPDSNWRSIGCHDTLVTEDRLPGRWLSRRARAMEK